jgi:hypothetical protein
MLSPPPPRKPCRLWYNVEKCVRAGQSTVGYTTRLTHIACWINKARTRTEYINNYCFYTATMVMRTRTRINLLLYVNCLSCLTKLWVSAEVLILQRAVECVWNLMAHGDAREGKWRGIWRMEWVASTLHTPSERDVSNITAADAHSSAASSRQNWRLPPPPLPDLNLTRPFRRKTKSGFCACAITFQTQSTHNSHCAAQCHCSSTCSSNRALNRLRA